MLKSKRSLNEAFYPLSLLNSSMGIKVFETSDSQPWLKLSISIAIGSFLVNGFLIWYAALYAPPKEDIIPNMMTLFKMFISLSIFMTVANNIISLHRYKDERNIFRRLSLVDETLMVCGIHPEYMQTYKYNLKIILIWCSTNLIIAAYDFAIGYTMFMNFTDVFLRMFPLEYMIFLFHMVELNFSLYVSAIGVRFKRLNSLFRKATKSPFESINIKNSDNFLNIQKNMISVTPQYRIKNRSNTDIFLKLTRQLHLELSKIARSTNEIFSKQISLLITVKFVLLTSYGYCFYVIYNLPNITSVLKMEYCGSLAVWIIVSIGRISYVVRTSVQVSSEFRETCKIAREILVSKSQIGLVDEINQLSLQTMQHPLNFTASGLIVLDFGFVRGFVGTVTTYLMILIQSQPDMIKAANTFIEHIPGNYISTTAVGLNQ